MGRSVPNTSQSVINNVVGNGLQWALESSDGILPTIDFRNTPTDITAFPTVNLAEGIDMTPQTSAGTLTDWQIDSSGIRWPEYSTGANGNRYKMSVVDLLALGGGPAYALSDYLYWVWTLRNTSGLGTQPGGDYFSASVSNATHSSWAFAGAVAFGLSLVRRSNTTGAVVGATAISDGTDIFLGNELFTGRGGLNVRQGASTTLIANPTEQDEYGTDIFSGNEISSGSAPASAADVFISPGWNDNGGVDPGAILESLHLYRLR